MSHLFGEQNCVPARLPLRFTFDHPIPALARHLSPSLSVRPPPLSFALFHGIYSAPPKKLIVAVSSRFISAAIVFFRTGEILDYGVQNPQVLTPFPMMLTIS
jgi:hypothetical protein